MIFQNITQYESAKKALIKAEGDVDIVFEYLKKDEEFSNLSESELYTALEMLSESLGDKIANFISGALGGDISKIKTVLAQMKEQELKFNKEEYDIYNEFYRLIQDQKALDKDKKNPKYNELSKELSQSSNALNIRMKELLKTHNEIFNSLEEKIKSLTKGSNRKKKYFNAQRATDVLETKNDRYEKIKAIIAKNSERSKELEDFFGINPEKVQKEVEVAKEKAEKVVDNLKPERGKPFETNLQFSEEPEKSYNERLQSIIASPGRFYAKRKQLESLISDIEDIFQGKDFESYNQDKKISLHVIYNQANDYLEDLEKEEKKITIES